VWILGALFDLVLELIFKLFQPHARRPKPSDDEQPASSAKGERRRD
jgi:hypothetical protein